MFEIPADVSFADDLDVQLNAEEYQDKAAPLPIAGNFGVRIKKSGLKKEYQKETLVRVDNKYPVIRIEELEIATPEENDGRRVFPFQEFGTKPYMRKDFAAGGVDVPANNLADIIRSTQEGQMVNFRTLEDGLQAFRELVGEGAIFHVRLDWLAEDRKWIAAQIKEIDEAEKAGGLTQEAAKKQRNEVRYKLGRQEGMTKFKDPNGGGYNPVWVSPSGDEIEAKTVIKEFIPVSQLKRYKLGARKTF